MYLINTNIWNTCKILPLPFNLSHSQFLSLKKKKKTDLCLWVCGTLVGNRSLRETMKAMIENPSTRFMADGLSIGNGPAFSMLHLSPQYVMALFCSWVIMPWFRMTQCFGQLLCGHQKMSIVWVTWDSC